MGRIRTTPRFCFILAAALTVLGVALRSLCMLTQFETDIGYFRAGFLPSAARWLYIIAALLMLAATACLPKDRLPCVLSTFRLPLALTVGAVLVLFSVVFFILFPDVFGSDSWVAKALVLLGLFGSVYFFTSAGRRGRFPDWLSALGFLPVFWCIAGIAETYLDQTVTMNSPIKNALQMGFIGFMFILLAELRFRLGKPPAPRTAVFLFGMGMFMTLNGSIPLLVSPAATDNTLHSLYAAVLLCAGLYGAYMLLSYTCHKPLPLDGDAAASEAEAEPAPDPADTPDPEN